MTRSLFLVWPFTISLVSSTAAQIALKTPVRTEDDIERQIGCLLNMHEYSQPGIAKGSYDVGFPVFLLGIHVNGL